MMVRFIRAHKWRKIGMVAKMTGSKLKNMIENKIVEEYTGQWPPDKKIKMKFNLKNLTQWQ